MHSFEMPENCIKRVISRQGRAHLCEKFDCKKTALIVIDMQNYFMTPPYLAACPAAQDLVPNINRLASSVRQSGGKVVWVQNLAPMESLNSWSVIKDMHTSDNVNLRWEPMQRDHHGFQLWPALNVDTQDERIVKRRYSAFIQGSSDIENVLRDHDVDTLIVAGVATNVCCESTARDAMMLNYRVVMVSDACAAPTDAEHAGALTGFYLFFGDVQSTAEVLERL
jgi:ureidoacrylate peracid hydrolase